MLVEHGSHAPVGGSGHDRVADAQGSGLHEHRRHGAATLVEVRLDGNTASVLVGVGAHVQAGIGGQQHRLEQLVDALALERGNVDEHRVAAVLLRNEVVLGELLANLGGVRTLLVDLVHRDHDRHVGRLSVVERLDGLGHHAVVGRDHEDRDVRDLGTTGTHGRERLVTGGVDERDGAIDAVVIVMHLVGADVLGDAAGLARDDVGLADGVEESRLAVVDVTHDGDNRRTRLELLVRLRGVFGLEIEAEVLEQFLVLVLGRHDLESCSRARRQAWRRCPRRATASRWPSLPGGTGPSPAMRD